MTESGIEESATHGVSADIQNVDTDGQGIAQLSSWSMDTPEEMYDELSDSEDIMIANISDEDVSSLLEPSISRAASRYKSAKTPAIEKALVMEDINGGGYFAEDPVPSGVALSSEETLTGIKSPIETLPGEAEQAPPLAGLSLGRLPSPRPLDPDIPLSPWRAGPKELQIRPTPALQGVFSGRTRSLSGGAEALKKLLPKGLPSMAQVSNLFGTSSSPTKNRFGSTPSPKESPRASKVDIVTSVSSAQQQEFSVRNEHPPSSLLTPVSVEASNLRRVTSDDSLLYHSLSRASSLGDDARFENHREQVNSRVKAIRDSLQDRSSFRMPQIPSMPSMPRVSSFGFNMNFLNTTTVPAKARWRSNTDPIAGILPSTVGKKRPNGLPNPAVGSAMTAVAVGAPKASTEAAGPVISGPNIDNLERVLEGLTGDIVVMGGYRGSILRSTKTNRQLWVPVKVGLNIRKANLEVGLEPEDEERMTETIYPSGMLQNIGPVDISKRLFRRLNECSNAKSGKLRVWDYGYDWRLSPHLLSRQLTQYLQKLPSNQPGGTGAIVIAHSLGGLITRHVCNHYPNLFAGIVYAGVPKSCVNILGPIRNGDAVLLSSRVLTAQVNFTLRTSFVLLPEDGGCFIDINTKEKYPVDFFNIDDWIKYRWSPCTDPPLPPRNPPTASGLGGLINRSNTLLSLPHPGKKSISGSSTPNPESGRDIPTSPSKVAHAADILRNVDPFQDRTLGMQMDNNSNPVSKGHPTSQSVSTIVTIPRDKALDYLRRTLAETKKFKQELHYKSDFGSTNRYPPLAVIYGKSTPTVFGAKVDGREGIPCSDSYDNLAFASGDGVCLAREAMLPEGYRAVSGGRINSDRGHVTLLGDLNAVGRALEAISKGRAKGIGLGEA